MIAAYVVAGVVVVIAIAVAVLVERRRKDAPTQPEYEVPVQLDRADFARPESAWLVVLFSSASCDSCANMRGKVAALDSDEVVVADIEWGVQRALHERYRIEAVPTVVIADAQGVVQRSFVGSATATDLWAAVAELREPGSTPSGGDCSHDLS